MEAVIPKVSKGAQKLKMIGIDNGGLYIELLGCTVTAGSCGDLPRLRGTKVDIFDACVVILSLERS